MMIAIFCEIIIGIYHKRTTIYTYRCNRVTVNTSFNIWSIFEISCFNANCVDLDQTAIFSRSTLVITLTHLRTLYPIDHILDKHLGFNLFLNIIIATNMHFYFSRNSILSCFRGFVHVL